MPLAWSLLCGGSVRSWSIVAVVILACGCVPPSTTTAVYGPFRAERAAALFERVETRVRSAHYHVLESDPEDGVLAVESRALDPCGRPASFVFQFHQGGWIHLDATGCGIYRTPGNRVVMPRAILREYVDFAGTILSDEESEATQ